MKVKIAAPAIPALTRGHRLPSEPPRIVIYSHDTFGLGHFRRCLKIARGFKSTYPQASILLVTGQPQAQRYVLPEGTDFIKLPAVVKTGDNCYEPRSLSGSFESIFVLRQNLIFEAVRTFHPHLFLVDHSPLGMKGEIQKTLLWLKGERRRTAVVLGLRDILDEPEKVCASWEAESVYAVLDDTYDRIFIYGSQKIFDPVAAYRFGDKARAKTSFTGFITDTSQTPASTPAGKTSGGGKEVLLTIGGGEDGAEIVATYLEMLARYPKIFKAQTTIVTGPFLPEAERDRFTQKAKGLPVRFLEFTPELYPYLQKADLVIAMGGYNTVTEILAFARKALLIPRSHPRKEQLLRAQRLSELGLVDYLSPDHLTPDTLQVTIASLLESDAQPLADARLRNLLPLDGAPTLARLCGPLLRVSAEVPK
jgi:predicted glycosyltransferase